MITLNFEPVSSVNHCSRYPTLGNVYRWGPPSTCLAPCVQRMSLHRIAPSQLVRRSAECTAWLDLYIGILNWRRRPFCERKWATANVVTGIASDALTARPWLAVISTHVCRVGCWFCDCLISQICWSQLGHWTMFRSLMFQFACLLCLLIHISL